MSSTTDMSDPPFTLLTGATGAIGQAIVERLVSDGRPVLAVDQNTDALLDLQSRCGRDLVSTVAFDLRDLESTPALLVDLTERFGPFQHLLLNAGVWPTAPIVEMSDEIWQENFAVNVTSPFMFLRGLTPAMAKAGGGAVVCTCSRNAHRSSTNNAAYDASKAALLALVRTAAGEFAQARIRVNAVSPGVVSTPSTAAIEEEPFRSTYLRQIPMNRYGTPADIAGACLFLLSDDAGFITGQDLIIDGGQIACQDSSRLLDAPEERD
jgi:3-oxoacyl-[acyl-carrier protein] reductase